MWRPTMRAATRVRTGGAGRPEPGPVRIRVAAPLVSRHIPPSGTPGHISAGQRADRVNRRVPLSLRRGVAYKGTTTAHQGTENPRATSPREDLPTGLARCGTIRAAPDNSIPVLSTT